MHATMHGLTHAQHRAISASDLACMPCNTFLTQ